MLKTFIAAIAVFFGGALFVLSAHADPIKAVVVSACGTPPTTYNAGQSFPITMDTTGKICDSSSSGGGSIVTPLTPPDLIAATSSTQAGDASTVSQGYVIAPFGVSFTHNITFSGTQTAATAMLWAVPLTLSGTASAPSPDGFIAPINIDFSSDTVATGDTALAAMLVQHVSSTGHTGTRTAFEASEVVNGTPGDAVNTLHFALYGLTSCRANLGGTNDGVWGDYLGACQGGAFQVNGTSAATGIAYYTGGEADISLPTGASAARKIGFNISNQASDQVHGTFEDAALQVTSNPSAVQWLTGLVFGGIGEKFPIDPTGTIIGVYAQTQPSSVTPTALNGVDFSAVTFQSGGCAYKSTAFCIDPSGNAKGASYAVGTNSYLTGPAAAVWQLGQADAAAPVAQTLQVQNVVAGTSNTPGQPFKILGSASTGSSNGGALQFETVGAGGSGSSVNAEVLRATITGPGQVLISASGTARTVANGAGTPMFQISNNSATATTDAAAILAYSSTAATGPGLYFGKSASATLGTQAAVATGAVLGNLIAEGSDGTNFQNSAAILFKVNGTVAAGQVPGEMDFQTATAAGSLTTAITIGPTQLISLPQVTTGTPVASLCIDASNNIIKKTTTGSCV